MLKLVMAALLSIAVVGCDKTPEEKQKAAKKQMAAGTNNGNEARNEGIVMARFAISQLDKKPMAKQSDADLRSIRESLLEAKKKLKLAIRNYQSVLGAASKKDDHKVELLNPGDFVTLIKSCKADIEEIDANINKIDEELAKQNRESATRT